MARILLTGATAVVGWELVRALSAGGHSTTCVSRTARTTDLGGTEFVRGDVCLPGMALDGATLERIADEVDLVIHNAGEVSFTATAAEYTHTNVTGARNCVEWAASVDARFVHVSTAYSQRAAAPDFIDRGRGPSSYTASKYAAEHVVRSVLGSATIVRPSIVVGRSTDAVIQKNQGLHYFLRNLMRARFSFLPVEPDWLLDTIPVDHLAAFIVAASDSRYSGENLWATAGSAALSVSEIMSIALDSGQTLPRFVHPEIFDRLIRPAFLPELPPEVARYVESLCEISDQLFTVDAFDSDLRRLIGVDWSVDDTRSVIEKTVGLLRDAEAEKAALDETMRVPA